MRPPKIEDVQAVVTELRESIEADKLPDGKRPSRAERRKRQRQAKRAARKLQRSMKNGHIVVDAPVSQPQRY